MLPLTFQKSKLKGTGDGERGTVKAYGGGCETPINACHQLVGACDPVVSGNYTATGRRSLSGGDEEDGGASLHSLPSPSPQSPLAKRCRLLLRLEIEIAHLVKDILFPRTCDKRQLFIDIAELCPG